MALPAGVLFSAAQPFCVGGREREWKALPPRWKQFMVLLLCSWAQGADVAIAASKRARHCATSEVRCAINRRLSSGDTLVSHRGSRTCGLPVSKGRLVISFRHPARSCARVAQSVKANAESSARAYPKCLRWRSSDLP